MSLVAPGNERVPNSQITDSRILRPGDELLLLGDNVEATIGVLDAHDPSGGLLPLEIYEFFGEAGWGVFPLPSHHHILMQLHDRHEEVVSAGMFAAEGPGQRLWFEHVTWRQETDRRFCRKLDRVTRTIRRSGEFGLYYVSADEGLSRTTQGRQYLRGDERWLDR